MPPPRAESRATTAGKWLLAAVTVVSALALGSVLTEVLVVMSVLAAVACGLLWAGSDIHISRAARWVLVSLAVLLGMTVLQALPLPSGVTHWLTPANADAWDRALSPFREAAPAWHSLSLAPGATRVEVLRGFFYACVFLGALRIALLERGDTFLVRLVVFSTCVMAVSALAHLAVGAEQVFGVYRPREVHAYRPGRLAPLLNTNHLAAYLNIGACVAIGALVSRRAMPRALSASATLVLAATSVWQGSRGATATLLLGVILAIGLTVYTKRSRERSRVNAAVLAGCAVLAAFIATIAMNDMGRAHLSTLESVKFGVWTESLRLVVASPWFGAGRGAFESVFSSVREGSNYVTFTHPEDAVVQWLVEWGVPVSLTGAGCLAWGLRPQVVFRAVNPAIGAWVAVIVTVLHELVDYHLEVPGIAALAAICVALVVNARATSRRSEQGRGPRSMRVLAAVAIVGTGVTLACIRGDVGHSLAEDRRKLSAMAIDKTASHEAFRGALREAMLRYPHEPYFPLMGAVRAQIEEDGTVVAWVGRALELNPRFGRAHFVLARSLAAAHPAQARLEYRLAYENDESLRDQIAKEGSRLVFDADTAMEIVPDGAAGTELLEVLVTTVAGRLPSTAIILDREIERRSPTATGPLRRRITAAIADSTTHAPWCAGDSCIADGLTDADRLVSLEPSKCESHALVASLRASSGHANDAADGLERAIDVVTDRAQCTRELIMLCFRTGQSRRGEAALEALVRADCGATAECIDLYTWAGGVEEDHGQYVRAVRLYKRALELVPDRDDLLERIGAMGSHQGVLADAVEAYRTLATRHPADPRWSARLAELRAGAMPSPRAPVP